MSGAQGNGRRVTLFLCPVVSTVSPSGSIHLGGSDPGLKLSLRSIGLKNFAFTAAAACGLALTLSQNVSAQTIVAPNAPETNGVNTALRQEPRQYQEYIDASQLTEITTPVEITGISFRLSSDITTHSPNGVTGSSFPLAPITFGSFTLQMARASTTVRTDREFVPSAANGNLPANSFQANMDQSTLTTVRSGPLTINPGAFPNDPNAAANEFGTPINFTTPYRYTPGQEMVYYINHSGYGNSQPQAFFATASFKNGVADAVSASDNTSSFPGGFNLPYIVRFSYRPAVAAVPGPQSVLVFALGGLMPAFAVLRRRKK